MGSFGWVCSTHAARCNITYQKRVFHWPFAHLQYYTEFTHVSLNFARGITVVPQEIEDSDYAKGLGKDKVYFVRCARNGELKNKSAVAVVFTHSKERNLGKVVCTTTYSSLAPFSSSSHSGLNRNFSWQQRRGAFFILSGGEFPFGYLSKQKDKYIRDKPNCYNSLTSLLRLTSTLRLEDICHFRNEETAPS